MFLKGRAEEMFCCGRVRGAALSYWGLTVLEELSGATISKD